MSKHTNKAEREAFILDWMKREFCADACNELFHEAYHKRFPQFKRVEKIWGAQPVAQALTDLKRMSDDGILKRGRIGLGMNWQPGFPRWVWAYTLNEHYLPLLRKTFKSD